MLWARLEDLALALCHSFLDLDDITGLRSTRIQSKLRRSPLSQLLTIPFRPVHNEYSGLLVKIRESLFKLPSPAVRGEVETLDSSVNLPSSPMNDQLSPIKENPSRTSRNLEAHHEDSILLLRSHILHVEDRRSPLQHPRRRNNYTWSFRGSSPIIPAVNPVSHLSRALENFGIAQSRRILQEQFHCVQSHSIYEDRMLEVVCGKDAEQLLRSTNPEGWNQHCPAPLHDLCNLLDKLLLQPIPNRMILHRIRSLHDNRVQVLVFGIRTVDEPCRLTIEVPSVEDPLPVTLDNGLSATRNMPRVNQSHRAVADISRLFVLQLTLMLEHRLQINI